ncbi:hydroxyneurosporene-O-methyltransferase [Phytohabitans suffuscus]|uniref:Hydroxyneurosporene-O-methyltransferase n=2 Tax=Phytohabitans suffuscus TaxID=624315 RepID=A0A6F8YR46_9ACTN|nr:hydroxyneurosporene-O-methyltransferase [Phytohabitans suffuscus]
MAFTYSAALRAVAALRVADQLAAGPRPVAEVAAAVGVDAGALARILRLLAGRGIFAEEADGRFGLAPAGQALRSDAAVPARSGVLMFTDAMFWTTSYELASTLRRDGATFADVFGMPLGEYFDRHADKEALFYDGMERVSDAENPLIAASYEFPASGTVADVGGRYGGLLAQVLRANPGLRGVLLDKPEEVAKHRLDTPELAGRWEVVGGDFFTSVPPADVLVLKRILHNLDDGDCVRLLRNCRAALHPGGTVLVVDAIVPADPAPHQSTAMDFMMLAAMTGKERTEAEIAPLLSAAGLRLTRLVPTHSVMSIVEAVPH